MVPSSYRDRRGRISSFATSEGLIAKEFLERYKSYNETRYGYYINWLFSSSKF